MARILHKGRTYRPYGYDSEEEFEQAVVDHSREIFGPDSVYFDIKKRLKNENVLTIPDGYLLDFSFQHSPRLYIIENELVEHDPFRHIGQQLLKFATAYEESRHKLKQALSAEIQSDTEKYHFIEERADEYEYLFVEGQGSIVHPAYSAVTCGILHGAMPDSLVLCHEAGRDAIRKYESFPMPTPAEYVDLYESLAAPVHETEVVAGALNTRSVEGEENAREAVTGFADDIGAPATDPVRFGVEEVLDAL